MSIGSFIKSLVSSKPVTAIEAIALTDAQKAVAALKLTKVGELVAAEIVTLGSENLTGVQKFEHAVSTAGPLIVDMLVKGGKSTAISEVEDIARALVQSVFCDVMSQKAVTTARSILSLLGIK